MNVKTRNVKTMKYKTINIFKYMCLTGITFGLAFPFLWMIFGAFKTNDEIWKKPYQLLPSQFDLGLLIESLKEISIWKYLWNSFFVGIVGTILILFVSALFVYGVVFISSPFMDRLFFVVMITYMLPGAVTYVPAYVLLAKLGMLDTFRGLIFSYLANIFVVFFLRQSFLKTSMDFIEAAKIDGANHWRTLIHVVFPLNKSAMCSVGLLTFIQLYNSYMWPGIMLKSQEKYLISQGLRQFFIQEGAYGMNWSIVMMASTLAVIPIFLLLIFAQKWIMAAISQDSGIK